MVRIALLAALAACASPVQPAARKPSPRPAVPSHAAAAAAFPEHGPFRIDHAFEPARYRVHIALGAHAFTGHVEIDGALAESRALLWLNGVDLVVTHAVARHGSVEIPLAASGPRDDQLLGLRARAPLAPGRYTIAIDYRGTIQELAPPRPGPRGTGMFQPPGTGLYRRAVGTASYYYTQGEAIYARAIFPCIDEPDRKVPWQLALDVPAGLVAASNTPIVRETALGHGTKRVEFAETLPLPSYLVAFAVGPFDVVDAGRSKSGVPIRILAVHGASAAATSAAASISPLLDSLEAWTGIPYAYGKLDLVMVPQMGLGAMENPGLITVDQQYLRDQSIIAHELAHQWFGDLVTPRWWDDIWLNESFADWLADKLVPARGEPSIDPVERRTEALAELETCPAAKPSPTSWRDLALPTFPDARLEERGAAVLRLLESYLGSEPMRKALHDYLAAHVRGNATTDELLAALDAGTGKRIAPLVRELLEDDVTAEPDLEAKLVCEHGVHVQFQAIPWTLPVCVAYDRDGKRGETCTVVDQSSSDLALDATRCPSWIMPDAGGIGPYRVLWSEPMVHDVLAHGWSALSSLERRSILDAVTEPKLQLEVFARLADSDGTPVLRQLLVLSQVALYVPDDVRAEFAGWLAAHLGPLAYTAPLSASPTDHAASYEQLQAVALLAQLGDARLARLARPFTTSVLARPGSSRFGTWILVLAADRDPAVMDALLAKALSSESLARETPLTELAYTHHLDRLLTRAADKLATLGPDGLDTLFSETCDGSVRDALAKLATTRPAREGFARALGEVDRCRQQQAELAPIFRAWLAPRHPHVATPRR